MRGTAHPGPGLSPIEARAWTGLRRAHAALVRHVDGDLRAAHGLNAASCDVLSEIAAAPGGRIRMGELAHRTRVTRAGLSGLVDRLERAGLVERQRCDADARGTYAAVTAAGLRRLERVERTYRDSVRRRYTSRIDDAELELVCCIWERVTGAGRRD